MTEQEYQAILKECAYKQLDECSEEELKVLIIERERCQSFVTFAKYLRVLEPPTQDNAGGSIPFEMWSHVKAFVKALLTRKLIVLLKSRQIGASWTIAAYCLWCALTKEGDISMLFSKGKYEAQELLDKCRRIYTALPPFLKYRVDPDSAMEMGFPAMKSSIKVFAATESAGISFTASRIVADEWIEHPFAEANYLASKPCIDAGGQFIGIFTTNKAKLASLPVQVYLGGKECTNGFTSLFFGWRVRPERTDEWYEKTKKSIPVVELGTLTPDMYMAANYPATDTEALSPSDIISAFDNSSLSWMMEQCRNPIIYPDIDNKIIHIYKPFMIGNYYIVATDTGHGVGKDFSVSVVLNVVTGEYVADIMSNIISPEELAYHTVKVMELYRSPLWYPEDNDWGRATILAAQKLGYKHIGWQDKKHTKVGFKTVGGETGRDAMWGSFIPAVNNRQVMVFNTKGLGQFSDLIRNFEKNGRIEAQEGKHDDYPFACAIAWFKRGDVHTNITHLPPIETLHFRS